MDVRIVRFSYSKSERGSGRREAGGWELESGEPERWKGPGEQMVPTRTNPSGANQGHGFFDGSKPLGRRYKVRESFVGKRESGERDSRGSFDHRRGGKLWRVNPRSVGS
jgi:hypothetical protein